MCFYFEIKRYHLSLYKHQSNPIFKRVVENHQSNTNASTTSNGDGTSVIGNHYKILNEYENELLYEYFIKISKESIPMNTLIKSYLYKTYKKHKISLLPKNIIELLISDEEIDIINRLLRYKGSKILIKFTMVFLTIYKDQNTEIISFYHDYRVVYSNLFMSYPIEGNLYEIVSILKNYSKEVSCNNCCRLL